MITQMYVPADCVVIIAKLDQPDGCKIDFRVIRMVFKCIYAYFFGTLCTLDVFMDLNLE